MKHRLLHFERHDQPLLSRREFTLRVLRHTAAGIGVLVVSLMIGVLGYHFFENLSWLDALLNASMILGGMGPVNPIVTPAGKVFASLYAIFSGMVFLAVAGVMMAPVAHRFLHRLHMEEDNAVNN
jgi:hypothetical protein